nr:hypothetical protein CFP56_07644 [Quercus suber]
MNDLHRLTLARYLHRLESPKCTCAALFVFRMRAVRFDNLHKGVALTLVVRDDPLMAYHAYSSSLSICESGHMRLRRSISIGGQPHTPTGAERAVMWTARSLSPYLAAPQDYRGGTIHEHGGRASSNLAFQIHGRMTKSGGELDLHVWFSQLYLRLSELSYSPSLCAHPSVETHSKIGRDSPVRVDRKREHKTSPLLARCACATHCGRESVFHTPLLLDAAPTLRDHVSIPGRYDARQRRQGQSDQDVHRERHQDSRL